MYRSVTQRNKLCGQMWPAAQRGGGSINLVLVQIAKMERRVEWRMATVRGT